jgi:hypothetical protein
VAEDKVRAGISHCSDPEFTSMADAKAGEGVLEAHIYCCCETYLRQDLGHHILE